MRSAPSVGIDSAPNPMKVRLNQAHSLVSAEKPNSRLPVTSDDSRLNCCEFVLWSRMHGQRFTEHHRCMQRVVPGLRCGPCSSRVNAGRETNLREGAEAHGRQCSSTRHMNLVCFELTGFFQARCAGEGYRAMSCHVWQFSRWGFVSLSDLSAVENL